MKTPINERLNTIIEGHVPKGKRVVPFLMEILNTSRESAYRRVRNEISYTLEEAALISSKLSISIDDILGSMNKEKAFFYINKTNFLSPTDSYITMIENTINTYNSIFDAKHSKATVVGNKLPIALLMQFEKLSKLNYFKWVHQTKNLAINSKFSDLVIPARVTDIHKEYARATEQVKDLIIIFDDNIIQATVKTIMFYYRRNLLTENELLELKKDLQAMLDRLEYFSHTGRSEKGTDIAIYVSALDIESNYVLFEYDEKECALFWSSGINPVVIHSKNVFEEQKLWTRSILKYSTLISLSNEIVRTDFFTRQRSFLQQLQLNS